MIYQDALLEYEQNSVVDKRQFGRFRGHPARMLKMAARAESTANGPNLAEIQLERPLWGGSGAPCQDAEKHYPIYNKTLN